MKLLVMFSPLLLAQHGHHLVLDELQLDLDHQEVVGDPIHVQFGRNIVKGRCQANLTGSEHAHGLDAPVHVHGVDGHGGGDEELVEGAELVDDCLI